MFGGTDPAVLRRLAAIERKLDLILDQLGVAPAEDGLDDIRALVAAGHKIEAIKLYRLRTGAGLAEAKSAIDAGL